MSISMGGKFQGKRVARVEFKDDNEFAFSRNCQRASQCLKRYERKGRAQKSNLEKEPDQVRCKSCEKDFGFDLIMFLKIEL